MSGRFGPVLLALLPAVAVSPACSLDPTVQEGIARTAGTAAGKALEEVPPPKRPGDWLQIDPPMLTFGMVRVDANATRSVIVINRTDKPLTITAIAISGADFAFDRPVASQALAPGESFVLAVRFTPRSRSTHKGKVTFTFAGDHPRQTLEITGGGVK